MKRKRRILLSLSSQSPVGEKYTHGNEKSMCHGCCDRMQRAAVKAPGGAGGEENFTGRFPWAEFWKISVHSPGLCGGGCSTIWRAVWTKVVGVRWSPVSRETARNATGLEHRFKVVTKEKA